MQLRKLHPARCIRVQTALMQYRIGDTHFDVTQQGPRWRLRKKWEAGARQDRGPQLQPQGNGFNIPSNGVIVALGT
jgi:hypothetical protein